MLKITDFAAKIAEIESCPDGTPFIWRESIQHNRSNRDKKTVSWTQVKTHVIYKRDKYFFTVEESLMSPKMDVGKVYFELSEDFIDYFLNFNKSSREEVVNCWIEDDREFSILLHKRDGAEEEYPEYEKSKKEMLEEMLKFLN